MVNKLIRKIQKIFNDKFDAKKFFAIFRSILFLFFIILCIGFIKITLSKYSSEVDVNISPNIAFFVTDVGRYENGFKIDDILPSTNPYLYSFTVSNFKDTKKSNVEIEYEIELIMTTNIPLNIKLFKNTSNFSGAGIISSDQVITNDDNVYFRSMKTNTVGTLSFVANQTDTYVISVEFPDIYKNSPEFYEGRIELIEIKVFAKQVI